MVMARSWLKRRKSRGDTPTLAVTMLESCTISPFLPLTTQPQISPPTLASAVSLPVKISTTPGIFFAAEVSMLLIFAWACGERRKYA